MPSVTINSPNLQLDGPLVEVHFLISSELEKKYNEQKKEIPKPVIVKALIDTVLLPVLFKKKFQRDYNLSL